MKTKSLLTFGLLILHSSLCPCAHAQSTAFTYQGRLVDRANPANGSYDFLCQLYDSNSNQVSITITNLAVPVSSGLFTTLMDFGDAFAGDRRWLNLSVRTNGNGTFTALTPGQEFTAAPYAMTAQRVTGQISDSQITGPILRTTFNGAYTGQLLFTPAGVAPFAVGSTTKVVDLNADLLDGLDSSAFWKLTGNAGTTPGTHFLGTTDSQALQLQVNNTIALQITPGATLPNIVGGLAAFRPSVVASGVSGAVIAGGNAPSGGVDGYGGGDFHAVYDNDGTVGGGFGNKVGSNNGDVTDAAFATVAGGVFNMSAGYAATVGGGDGNLADGARAAVLGGYANRAGGAASAVGGGFQNTIQNGADYATVSGGYFNRILSGSPISTIAGGQYNLISSNSPDATIGGGTNNSIGQYSEYATIAGGGLNSMPFFARGATISGGIENHIESDTYESVIGGGFVNHIYANADTSVIGGGYANEVRGARGVIPGGSYNKANGANSFAAGYAARALHAGCFVWSDPTGDFLFPPGVSSTGDNQFVIRATGGVQLDPATSLYCGGQTRQMLNLWGTQYGIGVQGYTMYSRADVGAGFAWYQGGTHSNAAGDSGGGQTLMSLDSSGATLPGNLKFGTGSLRQMLDLNGGVHGIGVQAWTTYFRTIGGAANGGFAWYKGGVHADNQFDAGGGTELMHLTAGGLWVNTTFVSASDRNLKENFKAVDARAVLDKVAALPLTEWNYKTDAATRHVGPMAQDFYAAFAIGPDDKHIATVDADGVALAAIQGLNQKVEEQGAALKSKDARIAELEQRLSAIETLLQK